MTSACVFAPIFPVTAAAAAAGDAKTSTEERGRDRWTDADGGREGAERRGSRGFKLTNGDLHLLAMATEGGTDGRADEGAGGRGQSSLRQ